MLLPKRPIILLISSLLTAGTFAACTKRSEPKPKKFGLQEKASLSKEKQSSPAALAYLTSGEVYNPEAPIPSQCYTKTDGVHNPCYVCHQTYADKGRPNLMADGFQQGSYAFSEEGETNSWKNLFRDTSAARAQISAEQIDAYVNQSNYHELVQWMKSKDWSGEVLELKHLEKGENAFDQHGLALDGSRWVAFNYKPFPSTFWPTNGAIDDIMVRLPEAFSQVNGKFSRDIYYANLAALELAIVGEQRTTTPPLNEKKMGQDINGDGHLGESVTEVIRPEHYFGEAKNIALSHMLYPKGTEFLHTVRYIGVKKDGSTYPSPRLKELRYMRKAAFSSPTELMNNYYVEAKEKHFEQLPQAVEKGDKGVSNSFGWLLLGFIENERGELRKQYPEEQHYCVGCHKAVGATIDQTFGFPRKVKGAAGWRYLDLTQIKDVPNQGETEGEYLTYMTRVSGGDEFRQNREMLKRWFKKDQTPDIEKIKKTRSIAELISPSPERARELNKAYLLTVKKQSYIYGRDVVLAPPQNVLATVDTAQAPLMKEHRYQWDIRLNWKSQEPALGFSSKTGSP